jgi:hypothetical protein
MSLVRTLSSPPISPILDSLASRKFFRPGATFLAQRLSLLKPLLSPGTWLSISPTIRRTAILSFSDHLRPRTLTSLRLHVALKATRSYWVNSWLTRNRLYSAQLQSRIQNTNHSRSPSQPRRWRSGCNSLLASTLSSIVHLRSVAIISRLSVLLQSSTTSLVQKSNTSTFTSSLYYSTHIYRVNTPIANAISVQSFLHTVPHKTITK